MSEAVHRSMQTTVSSGRISATWFDGCAIWLCDYYSHHDPDIEALQLARREKNLTHTFRSYKLLDPTVEILEKGVLDMDTSETDSLSDIGGRLLRVATLLMPYVDPRYIRPVVELRQPPPTVQQVEEVLVLKHLHAGGQAIHTNFGSAMIARKQPQ